MKKIITALEYIKTHSPNIPLEKRFYSKFKPMNKNKCWNWDGAKNLNGYGYLMVNIKAILASRISWFLNFGPIPDGMCVCHKCDNRLCVNPHHLFLGTKKDNAKDAESKGRLYHPIGENSHLAKLNSDDVKKIRKLFKSGVQIKEIAKQYGMNRNTIGGVARGKLWIHI